MLPLVPRRAGVNVGFYYHVEVNPRPGELRVPSNIGYFVRELAEQAGAVTFFAHRGDVDEAHVAITEPSLTFVDLGPRRSFPARTLRPGPAIRRLRPALDGLDVMLVRGPSPLLPHVVKASGRTPVCVWLQGAYATATPPRDQPAWRRALIEVWKRLYEVHQERSLRGASVIVNSAALRARRGPTASADVVFSSVLPRSATEGPSREEPRDGPFRLLYVGRLAEEKGLLDLLDAVRRLIDSGLDLDLKLVGGGDERFLSRLASRAHELALDTAVRPTGPIPLGESLFAEYRSADAFVLPSYHEGFPHVLIEAMAFGLPVVATRVGDIPNVLSDGVHASLVPARSVDELAAAVARMIEDPGLRARISTAGREWAKDRTLERSCELVLSHLAQLVAEGPRR